MKRAGVLCFVIVLVALFGLISADNPESTSIRVRSAVGVGGVAASRSLEGEEATDDEHGGEEGDDEEEHEEEISKQDVATSIFLILTFLIVVTIIFEHGKEKLIETSRDTTREIFLAMFSEMTVLGFLSIVTFVVSKAGVLQDISIDVFGEEEEEFVKELFESVHMILFMVMILFIMLILFVLRLSIFTEKEWECAERSVMKGEVEAQYLAAEPFRNAWFFNIPARMKWHAARTSKEMQLLRQEFIQPRDTDTTSHLPKDFHFAKYLSLNMGRILGEVIECDVPTWLCVEAGALLFYVLMVAVDSEHEVLLWAWITIGWVGLLFVMVFMAKLRWIRGQLMPEAGANGSGGAANEATGAGSEMKVIIHVEQLESPPYLSRPYSPRGYSNVVMRSIYGQPPSRHESLFWLGGNGPKLHLYFIRLMLLSQSIYVSVLCLEFLSYTDTLYGSGPTAAVFVLAIFPIVAINVWYMPQVIRLHIVVTSIEQLKDPKVIRDVVRLQKTQKAVRALMLLNKMHRAYLSMSSKGEQLRRSSGQMRVLPVERRREIEAMFDLYDKDGSGEIDALELQALMRSLGQPVDQTSAVDMLNVLDANGDGSVSKDEFVMWMAASHSSEEDPNPEELAEQLFKRFDTDGSGSITHSEFMEGLEAFGANMTADEVADLVRELDADHDGSISKEEFADLLKQHVIA